MASVAGLPEIWETIPPSNLGPVILVKMKVKTDPKLLSGAVSHISGNPVTEANG